MPTDDEQRAARVLVIGGGVAGLTAARDLALAGKRVTLVEAETVLGGRIKRANLAGIPVDIGAEAFATRGGGVQALIAELGLAERVVRPSARGAWIVGADLAVPLPEAGALGIPARPLARAARRSLGVFGALRAAIEPLLPRSVGRDADSLGGLVRARLGWRVLEWLVAPVALGVYSADPRSLPIDAVPGLPAAYRAHGSLIKASRELREGQSAAGGAVSGLDDGMTVLVDALAAAALAAGVEIRLGLTAAELVPAAAGNGYVVHFEAAEAAQPESIAADAVVLAVPERTARKIVGAAAAPAAKLEAPVEVVALLVADDRLDAAPRGTGVLVAAGAQVSAKALTHTSAKWPGRAFPAGTHVLRLSYGRANRTPETVGLSDAAVAELALADASRLLGLTLQPTALRALARQTWANGLPPSAERSFELPPSVVAVGDWVSGSGLASVIPGTRAIIGELLAADQAAAPARAERTARSDRTSHQSHTESASA